MQSSVLLVPLLLVQAIWLLAPGLLAGLLLAGRDRIPAFLVVPVAGLAGCVSGLCRAVGVLRRAPARQRRRRRVRRGRARLGRLDRRAARAARRPAPARRRRAALALLLLLTLGYTAITFSCTAGPGAGSVNAFCHLNGFTGDNVLPQIFADNIHHGDPRTITWDWQGSDRPPLQSGVQLLQAPLTESASWRS